MPTNILPLLRASPGAVISSSVSLYLQSSVVNNFKNYVGTNNMRHHLYNLLWGFVVVTDVLIFFCLPLYNWMPLFLGILHIPTPFPTPVSTLFKVGKLP